MLKYTKGYLSKLEDLISEGGYMVRYEKGNFKSGFCILKESKLVLINNFLTLEGRINCLTELIGHLQLERELLTDKSLKILHSMQQATLNPELNFNQNDS